MSVNRTPKEIADIQSPAKRVSKKPLDEQRLITWYEDALDLENDCRYWEKGTATVGAVKLHSNPVFNMIALDLSAAEVPRVQM